MISHVFSYFKKLSSGSSLLSREKNCLLTHQIRSLQQEYSTIKQYSYQQSIRDRFQNILLLPLRKLANKTRWKRILSYDLDVQQSKSSLADGFSLVCRSGFLSFTELSSCLFLSSYY